MRFQRFAIDSLIVFVLTVILFVGGSTQVFAASNNSSDENSNPATSYSGVMIDAKGLLHRSMGQDYGRLSLEQLRAAQQSASRLPQNIQKQSKLRYVSLNRLEKAIVDANGTVTEEMRYLAGMQRIQYVFYFPETKDIVVAGPAEGWFPGYEGVMVGQTTGRPVCELQDLVVALRAYSPNAKSIPVVGCSIDPTEEGNARLQQFVHGFGRYATPDKYPAYVAGLKQNLGLQTIRVDGIPANTHAALVMVSADYRMKLIGIGVEKAPVPITTFISIVDPNRVSRNALFRWFFVPDYQSVVQMEDKTGIEMIGNGVKLVAEDEIVSATGERTVKSGRGDKASREFARSFTEMYPKLAQKSLVYGQLRNFIDMLVAAAFLDKQEIYQQAGWNMEFLGDESKFAVETYNTPTQVEPVVGSAMRKGLFMAPIGGGVEIEAEVALKPENVKTETKNEVSSVKNGVKLDLQPGQWWWD